MALSTGEKITASDYINLKNRVKEEMKRRKYIGSLTAYAGSSYDYTIVPASGVSIAAEHQAKIVTPMRAVNGTTVGTTAASRGNAAVSISNLDTILTKFESKALTPGSTDCASSCSGLCHTECGNTCKGCSGTCEGSCKDTCTGSCTGDCTGDCSGTCTGCSGSCSGGCTSCSGTCSGGCSGSCSGGCSSCSGSCSGGCTNDYFL